tara:strand:+ start:5138 stop:6919 length:1782 start_codon:yes stop_codon:yes gene_type:complete
MKDDVDSKFILGCFVFLAVIIFSFNNTPLFDQDEAAYAGFAKNMLESKNWLFPEFMWSDIHRKTPLHFWNIAIVYKLIGVNEFAVRFSSSLFVFLTYVIVYKLGKKIVNTQQAFYASMILATSLLVPSLGKMAVTDGTLLFFNTLCTFSLIFILKNKSWKWVIIFWISFSLALLCKGPPIIIFCSLFGILLLIHPKRKNLIILHPWIFLPIAALPVMMWGYFTIQEDGGELLLWMWDWYVVKRVNSSVLGQTGPPGTHLLLIVLFFLPWLTLVPKGLKAIYYGLIKTKHNSFLIASWFVSSWLIFEFSPSKLPSYVVSAHIPFAFFISFQLDKISSIVKIKYWIIIAIFFQAIIWMIALPTINNLRNNTLKVSNYIQEKGIPKSHVLVGNNDYHPPSLPFYLSRLNHKLGFDNNLSTLIWQYYQNDPLTLVLNENQKDLFKKLIPNIKIDTIGRSEFLSGFLCKYYIISKPTNNISYHSTFLYKDQLSIIPTSKKDYRKNIKNNLKWQNSIREKAKKYNKSYEIQIKEDIDWLYTQDSLLYIYQKEMYKNPRWMKDLKLKQKKSNQSIEEILKQDLLIIKNNSNNGLGFTKFF